MLESVPGASKRLLSYEPLAVYIHSITLHSLLLLHSLRSVGSLLWRNSTSNTSEPYSAHPLLSPIDFPGLWKLRGCSKSQGRYRRRSGHLSHHCVGRLCRRFVVCLDHPILPPHSPEGVSGNTIHVIKNHGRKWRRVSCATEWCIHVCPPHWN